MDIKKLKEKFNKKVHPVWVWVLAVIMGLFSFVSYNVLFEPSFIPAPIIDISKKVVGTILGDQDIDLVDNNDAASSNQNNVSQNNSNQPSSNTDNWKTYENKELGFSVKYPSDWVKRDTGVVFNDLKDINIDGAIGYISINKYEDKNSTNLDQWIIKNKELFIGNKEVNEVKSFSQRENININGNIVQQFTTESMGEVRDTVIQKGFNFYVIEGSNLSTIDNDSKFLPIYNGLVNSIDFI